MPSTIVPPDVLASFQALAPHAIAELGMYERIATALKSLRYEDAASRRSTAAALIGIQAQIGSLAAALAAVRSPARLAAAHAARVSAMKHMAAAAGEVANALTGDPAARSTRLEVARHEAEAAEGSSRGGASAITAALGVAAATVATVPVVGQIIGAVLMAIAAVLVLVGQILAQSQQDDAAKKKKESPAGQPTKKDDVRP